MNRALFWAERGRGRTSPNPLVGAVLVSPDGVVVGQGAHLDLGGPHAEINALQQAGDRARGATLYCTLEPCSHTGRTGPCVARVVEAGVARVVVSVEDANPLVAGRGLAYLRDHGVEVSTGVGAEQARRQLAPFFTWISHRRPFVIVKSAVSLDGYVGRTDRRVQLTGPVADRYFHRQRAEIDAIAVGAGTVLVDDPVLTARGAYRARPLTRVIVDWHARVPATARVFSTLQAGPVIMVVLASERERRADHFAALEDRGVEVDAYDTRDLRTLVTRLATRPVMCLLVEGGPVLQAAFADLGLVDRVQWVVVPRELGEGVPVVASLGASVHAAAPALTRQLGDDLLMEFDVHRTD